MDFYGDTTLHNTLDGVFRLGLSIPFSDMTKFAKVFQWNHCHCACNRSRLTHVKIRVAGGASVLSLHRVLVPELPDGGCGARVSAVLAAAAGPARWPGMHLGPAICRAFSFVPRPARHLSLPTSTQGISSRSPLSGLLVSLSRPVTLTKTNFY